MNKMKLEIVTPLGIVYDGNIKSETLPGEEGEFGVLPQHASLVSLLSAGVIDIQTVENKSVIIAIESGYVKVKEDKTTCIVDGAVAVTDEDGNLTHNLDSAKTLLKKAEVSSSTMANAMSKIESVGR